MCKQAEDLREKLTDAGRQVADLRVQLEKQEAANRDLKEAKARLEKERKTSHADYVAAKSELEAVKKTLHDVHSELTGTSKRVRQRYMKEKDSELDAVKQALCAVTTEVTRASGRVRQRYSKARK